MRGTLTAPRLFTLICFLVLTAVCSYWALQILAPRPAIAPSASIGDNAAAPNLSLAATLFGSRNAVTAAPQAPSNIQVSGILEAGPQGVVILSVDGKPGTFYGVGASVTDGTAVKSIGVDKVVLEQRGRLVELKTPDRSSLGILSGGSGKASASREGGSTPPVPVRAATPTSTSPPPMPRTFQPPQPPQQQEMQQVQEQQLQQHQYQPQEQPQDQQLQQPDAAPTQEQPVEQQQVQVDTSAVAQ